MITGGLISLLASPYLAGLVLTVPDRGRADWWRSGPAARSVRLAVAAVAVPLGVLVGRAAPTAALPAFLVLALACAPLVIIDVRQLRLPDRLLAPAALAAAVLLAIAAAVRAEWFPLARAAGAAVGTYLLFFVVAWGSPRSFGFGDVKLAALLAGYLGWLGWTHVVYGLFAGFVCGSVVALFLLLLGRAAWRSHLPFGPALIVGAMLVAAF